MKKQLDGVQILLIEDEPDIADLFSLVLKDSGAQVTKAASAMEALQELHHQIPDILVCNIRLPDIDGDQLLRYIRSWTVESTRYIPAIAVTSYTREVNSREICKAGFDRFMSKPVDADRLVLAIQELLNARTA